MWTQIVGKIRMRLTPLVNHWWNVPLYVTARGLTTSCIPYGERSFELRFDFIRHQLVLETSDGIVKKLPLQPMPVADFYAECMTMLRSADIDVRIWPMPVEIPDPIPFDKDRQHQLLRSRIGAEVLANPAFRRRGLAAIPIAIHREIQPRAFLLGQFRSCGDAILRAQSSAPSWCGRRSRAKRIRTKSAASASGPARGICGSGILFVHGAVSHKDSAMRRCFPQPRATTQASANSF